MRWPALYALVLIVASACAARAHAESSWYMSGSLGAYFQEDQGGPTTFSRGVQSGPGVQQESFSPGIVANLALGYKFPARIRVEAEIGYAGFQDEKINPVSASFPQLDGRDFTLQSGGDQRRYMGTLNVFYDFPVGGSIVPYVGVGLGGVHAEASQATFVSASGTKFNQSGGTHDHGLALVEGGVSIDISDDVAIVPAYRYIHFFANGGAFGDEVTHIFKVGLRYSF
jgi:opacity protein-like surface antigen